MQKSQQPLTEADWLFAYDHLNMVMAECLYAGTYGVTVYHINLMPLYDRYNSGERTQELYDAITELK